MNNHLKQFILTEIKYEILYEKFPKEKKKLANKKWREQNRDYYLSCLKEYNHKNKEILKIKKKERIAKNPEEFYNRCNEYNKTYQKQYYNQNKEKYIQKGKQRRAHLRGGIGTFSVYDEKFLYSSQQGKCVVCRKNLNNKYDVDHILPLSKGGRNDKYNIQLLCSLCNKQKAAKDPIEFMQSRGYLL